MKQLFTLLILCFFNLAFVANPVHEDSNSDVFVFDQGGCDFTPTLDQDDIILCPNEVVTVSTEEYDSYQWYKELLGSGDPELIEGETGQSIEIDAFNYAVYNIWCEATLDGCTEPTESIFIDSWAFIPPAIMSDGISDICEGDSTLLANAFGMYATYQWLDGNGEVEGATNSEFWVTESGSYTLTVSPFECPDFFMNSGVPVTITVNPLPEPVIENDDGDLSTENTWSSYQWYQGGVLIMGATDQTYTPEEDGVYTVVVTDDNGCEGESDEFDFIVDFVDSFNGSNVSFSPNPFTNELNVSLQNGDNFRVILYDIAGKVVLDERHNGSAVNLDVSHLQSGAYFAQIEADDEVVTKRVLKR